MSDVAAEAVAALRSAGATVATAESLTGGLVCASLVSVPGASAAVRGAVVAYATPLKHVLLGVPEQLLAERGAVDPDVARAMAEGVRARLEATWGVATTGVAGPDPQDGQPVGTVYVAVAGPDGTTVQRLGLSGARQEIRQSSVAGALEELVRRIGNA